MSTKKTSPTDNEIATAISGIERQFAEYAKAIEKLSKAIKNAKASKSAWPLKAIAELSKTAKACNGFVDVPDFDKMQKACDRLKAETQSRCRNDFAKELRRSAEERHVSFKMANQRILLGPFELVVEFEREEARLSYAKTFASDGLPLDADKLVIEVERLGSTLLEEPENLKRVADEIETAVRVCLARKGHVKRGQMRAELPQVYRELQFARHDMKGITKIERQFLRSRFVVELCSVAKSDDNLNGTWEKRFRLETAVIENSKKESKSVFVPDNIKLGAGEGKYYQAIIVTYE